MVFVSAEGQMNGCLVDMGAIGHYHKAYRYMEPRTPPLPPSTLLTGPNGPLSAHLHGIKMTDHNPLFSVSVCAS